MSWYIGFPGEVVEAAVEKAKKAGGDVVSSAEDIRKRVANNPVVKFVLDKGGLDELFTDSGTESDDSMAEKQYGNTRHESQES